ncbi:MAG: Cytochrome monooxygenase [Chloroflexi bacterium]|nr:Cytochrome monooxygenase [Chloroflexota bacterium]
MKPTPSFLPGAPLLGNALEFNNNRHALIQRGLDELGPVFAFKIGPKPVAVLIGPDYQQFFFMETDKKLSIDKPYRSLEALFGEVAFLAGPEVYQEQRPILHSPFQREKMLKYMNIMQCEVQAWLDSLGPEGEMDISAEMGRLVQNVAGNALMGQNFQSQVGREFWDLYADLGKSLNMVIPPNWPTPKNIRRDRAKRRMRQLLEPIIAERRQNPGQYDDFLQDFIETPSRSGSQADDETIISLLRALMFASHETTAGQAAWTIIEILRHPDYEALVRQELEVILPPRTAIDGTVLRNLEHVAWAVREIERLHPSADILMRLAEEDIEVGDFRVPKDWLVLISPMIAHRLPEWFDEPERFDPQRFAPGREEDRRHRFSMVGFGGGVHKCAGMNFANNEMMTITALLFQQFELELLTPNPGLMFGLGAARPEPTRIHYRRI